MKNKGFTIIEVIISLIILIIVIIGSSVFFYNSRKNLVNANLERLGTWKAIEKMELLKSGSYSNIINQTENISLGGTPAQIITSVQNVDENGTTFKLVKVEVNWGNNSVSLTTYIAEK
ncbi:MAG TPA: prepilin-type N-terminal cleavage/methylation domain-containing protein [Candidatus Ratteibacteria bacterium]|nr:prepilin-type N-terminal cleavage/methylation domain-containing protein [bacterium]HRR95877.1 prepilin-type N-terminal cleavage/methylation domain-containing protein [Candidatus Ratteibacteria bacterium]